MPLFGFVTPATSNPNQVFLIVNHLEKSDDKAPQLLALTLTLHWPCFSPPTFTLSQSP